MIMQKNIFISMFLQDACPQNVWLCSCWLRGAQDRVGEGAGQAEDVWLHGPQEHWGHHIWSSGFKFNMEHMLAKTATLDPHLILNHGNSEQFKTFHKAGLISGSPENKELYWYLLELFTDSQESSYGSSKGGSFLILDFAVYFCSL